MGFGLKPERKALLEDLDVHWRIILKWISKKEGRMRRHGLDLAEDRVKWQALVNTVKVLWVP
jgi:hypothetical protein